MARIPERVRRQCKACSRLVRFRDIPGYRRLPWLARKKLDGRAFVLAVIARDFWFGCLIVVAGMLLANILCWRFDLAGWHRDLLRALPLLLAAPGIATLRRRLIIQLVRAAAAKTRTRRT